MPVWYDWSKLHKFWNKHSRSWSPELVQLCKIANRELLGSQHSQLMEWMKNQWEIPFKRENGAKWPGLCGSEIDNRNFFEVIWTNRATPIFCGLQHSAEENLMNTKEYRDRGWTLLKPADYSFWDHCGVLTEEHMRKSGDYQGDCWEHMSFVNRKSAASNLWQMNYAQAVFEDNNCVKTSHLKKCCSS